MNFLKKQLEDSRLDHTLTYIRSSAKSLKHLTSSEVAHLNQMIVGDNNDPWRVEAVSIELPSGKKSEFHVFSNPVVNLRNILTYANEQLEEGLVLEAATYLYSQLVLHHFFRDANRRTAVAAAYWLVHKKDYDFDVHEILKNKLGDLREEGEIRKLKNLLKNHLKSL